MDNSTKFQGTQSNRRKGPIEETNKSPETNSIEIEIGELPDKKLKITVMEMFSGVRKMIREQNESIYKGVEN